MVATKTLTGTSKNDALIGSEGGTPMIGDIVCDHYVGVANSDFVF